MILTRKLLGLCMVASSDSVRPALNAVKLEEKRAIATDGYRLLVLDNTSEFKQEDIPSRDWESLENDTHLFNANDLKKALSNIPTKASLPVLKTAWTAKGDKEKSVKIVSTDLDTVSVLELQETEATFPDVDKVLNEVQEKPVTEKVRVNPKLLVEMLQAMMKSGSSEYVDIELRGGTTAIIVKSKDNDRKEMTGLVMPMRTQ